MLEIYHTPYRRDFGKAGTHCFLDMQLHSRMNMQFASGQISEQIGFSALISMHGSDIAKLHTILRNTFLFFVGRVWRFVSAGSVRGAVWPTKAFWFGCEAQGVPHMLECASWG